MTSGSFGTGNQYKTFLSTRAPFLPSPGNYPSRREGNVGNNPYICTPYDRPSHHRPDTGRGADLRCRVGLRDPAQARRQLRGPLPLPRRQDALVLRLARQGPLQMLRLRQGWQCRPLHHGARTAHLSRGPALPGQEIRHRNQGTRTDGRRKGRTERAREPVRGQPVGQRLLPPHPAADRGRTQHRHGLLPEPRLPRRHHREVPAGLLHREPRRHGPRGTQQGLQEGIPGEDRPLLRDGRPPPARPFLGTRHLSRPHA